MGTTTSRPDPRVTLLAVLLGVLVVAMSIAGTAVAVPRIGADLHASGTPLQWVVAGYNLAFAAFTLVCGSLADTVGRRRTFAAGATLFAAGALVSAAAHDIWLLDAARILAGIGGAAVMASGGALLANTFEGPARTRAFAAMGTMAGVGIAIGPSLSGWLVDALGWRASFVVYAVVGAVILLGTMKIAESRAAERTRLDKAGAVTFVAGLALVMFGIMQGPESGWSSPLVLGTLAAGLVVLVFFTALQRHREHPVLDLTLVRDPRFLGWNLATLTTSVGFLGVLVFLPTYLQGVNGASAQAAGATMLMLTAPVLALPPLGGALVNRGVPARGLMTAALLLVAGGNAWLSVLRPGIGTAALLGPLLLIGIGMGISFGITDGQAMSVVEPSRAGMAAGFLNTVRGAAEALVIAVFSAGLLSLLSSRLGSPELAGRVASGELSGGQRALLADAFTDAWRVMLWTTAALCAIAACVVHALLASRRTPGGNGTATVRSREADTANTADAV
ncbi:MFS transporter [Streptomyces iconiensis]|uniref:MFS transporter n=1 Tax=Streptomyces iconiensis TaxID=1384038 RepID=A0ABT6ZRB8_9ACTN|nr:MFS transporter [Streptomyces iconiensis]MDJ1131613.1 MFS transporter [Streptomyces iconiensis]